MAIRHILAWCVLALVLTGVPAMALGAAKPSIGLPRTIEAKVGETSGLRLMSNDLKRLHWFWLRKPKASIARALPPQMLPENDEAVNGLSGRTSIYIIGRSPGTTTGLLGYFTANRQRLLKTVSVRIIVSLRGLTTSCDSPLPRCHRSIHRA